MDHGQKTFASDDEPNARTRKFRQHKWSKKITSEVSRLVESDNYHGIVEVAEDWIVIALSILLSKISWEKNIWVGWCVYILALVLIGSRMRALADILHQASHGCLASNATLNFILGTVCSGYWMFQSFAVYHKSHVLLHHPFLGNPYQDPDYQEYIQNKLCGSNRNSANTKKYLWSIFSPQRSWSYVAYVVRNRIYNAEEPPRETQLRMCFAGAVLGCICYTHIWTDVLWYWVVPYVTTNVYVGAFLELCEHFPLVDGTVSFVDVNLTRNRLTSCLTNFVLGVHWEGYHLVHHLFPKIPSWNYAAVHEILMQDADYAKLDHGEAGWCHIVQALVDQSASDDEKKSKSTSIDL